MPNSVLRVTSDVKRDLLASAAQFKSEATVVWEYVANSLQYVERGTTPAIQVVVDQSAKSITISDNGRGMSAEDLDHFFRMHGENRDRQQGRLGRGKFGTGKSAAFGIARELRVDTRRAGRRNVVHLTREMIDTSSGDEIPLAWDVRDEACGPANGTTVTIGRIVLQGRLRNMQIIEYVERHLQSFRQVAPQVAIGDHICEFREPAVAETHSFLPSPAQAKVLGDVTLTIKVAQTPLSPDEVGISIFAGVGSLVGIEAAGVDRKEMCNYLFGDVDVPALETFTSELEPYDSSRSLRLNAEHPVVRVLVPFIGASLEQVRASLVARRAKLRQSELQKQLDHEASEIADILNQDFESVRRRLGAIRAAAASAGPAGSAFGSVESPSEGIGAFVAGTSEPGTIPPKPTPNPGEGKGRPDPQLAQAAESNLTGDDTVDPVGSDGKAKRRPRGGFQVAYEHLGADEGRSFFDEASLRILINLDHGVIRAALEGNNVEDPSFRRLSYEVAFSEYAIALGRIALRQDPDLAPDDLLFEIRSSLNRIASAAAGLYRSS